MKSLISLLILTIIAFHLHAQVTVRVYPTLQDYVQKQSIKSSVFIQERTAKSLKSGGGNKYMIYSEINSPDLNDFIENDAWLIRHNDSLFFNCSQLKSTEYTLVLVKNDQYLFFIAGASKLKEHRKQMPNNNDFALASVAFGALGGAIVGYESSDGAFYYLLDLHTGKIQVLDRDGIASTLATKPELKREYLSKASPMDAETVTRFMQRLLN